VLIHYTEESRETVKEKEVGKHIREAVVNFQSKTARI
jgi:hypothetical protein